MFLKNGDIVGKRTVRMACRLLCDSTRIGISSSAPGGLLHYILPSLILGLLDRVDMFKQAQDLTEATLPDDHAVLIRVILSKARLTGTAEPAMMLSNKHKREVDPDRAPLREFYGIALASTNRSDTLPNEPPSPLVPV
ncbi:hypothetical protein BJ138DRAFT_1115858 [Hygrophoropsis aurantiaca]|uniref:Uncharacterized protein n=1 Tax=Hygrophoropsis aurantiaca TaxID=72124 RepID=A0ACB8A5D5_9AGAM|nr:hypothetical protein BJ138DRAFT_1115858 [Hygrophoropsis aurantiaca]